MMVIGMVYHTALPPRELPVLDPPCGIRASSPRCRRLMSWTRLLLNSLTSCCTEVPIPGLLLSGRHDTSSCPSRRIWSGGGFLRRVCWVYAPLRLLLDPMRDFGSAITGLLLLLGGRHGNANGCRAIVLVYKDTGKIRK